MARQRRAGVNMTNENEKILIARITYKRPDQQERVKYIVHEVYAQVDPEETPEYMFSYEEGEEPRKPKLVAKLKEIGALIIKTFERERSSTVENDAHNEAIARFNVHHGKEKSWRWDEEKNGAWTEGYFHIGGYGNVDIRTPYDSGRGVKKHEVRKALVLEWLKEQGIDEYNMTCSMEFPQDDCSRIGTEARQQARTLLTLVPGA